MKPNILHLAIVLARVQSLLASNGHSLRGLQNSENNLTETSDSNSNVQDILDTVNDDEEDILDTINDDYWDDDGMGGDKLIPKHEHLRIIGGFQARTRRYKYFASLQRANTLQHFCGGSLITPTLVLTAAHCRKDFEYYAEINGKRYLAKEQIVHPNYERVGVAPNYDAMLIVLAEPVVDVTPLMLNAVTSFPVPYTPVTAIGRGYTSYTEKKVSPDLMEVGLHTITNEECKMSPVYMEDSAWTHYRDMVTDQMICAESFETKDTCNGDSGGPVFVKGADASFDIQVGIVSWGYKCAVDGYPGVYVRLSEITGWIDAEVFRMSGGFEAAITTTEPSASPTTLKPSPEPTSSPTTASPTPVPLPTHEPTPRPTDLSESAESIAASSGPDDCPDAYDPSKTDYLAGDTVSFEYFVFSCLFPQYCNPHDELPEPIEGLQLWRDGWLYLGDCTKTTSDVSKEVQVQETTTTTTTTPAAEQSTQTDTVETEFLFLGVNNATAPEAVDVVDSSAIPEAIETPTDVSGEIEEIVQIVEEIDEMIHSPVAPPTPAPLKLYHRAARGCLRNGSAQLFTDEQVDLCLSNEHSSALSVNCCSGSEETGDLDCSRDGCFETMFHSDAEFLCKSQGKRLCTFIELESQACCRRGCNFDKRESWTSDVCE